MSLDQQVFSSSMDQVDGAQSKDLWEFLNALKTDDYKRVKELSHLSSESFGKERTTSLIIASRYCGVKVIQLLLQTDSSLLTRKDDRNREPALVAAAYGNYECLQILLDAGVSLETKYEAPSKRYQLEEQDNGLIDQMVVPECDGRTLLHEAAYYGMDNCVDVIVKKFEDSRKYEVVRSGARQDQEKAEEDKLREPMDERREIEQFEFFESTDKNGKTALDLALSGINKIRKDTEMSSTGWVKCIAILLRRSALYFEKIYEKEKKQRTCILDVPVDLLTEVFDQQISCGNENTISIDFGIICPKFDNYRILYDFLENESLDRNDRQVVFRHPLMRAFVRERWQCICNLFYLNVIFYVLHVLSLSVFITLAHCDVFYFGYGWKYETARQGLPISRCVLIVTTFLVSGHVFSLSALTKHYRWKPEMWLNFSSCLLSFTVAFFTDYKGYSTEHADIPSSSVSKPMAPSWVIHVSCLSVLIAWLELNLLVGRFPRWGAQALLFAPVLRNVIKVLITYGCMILGFSFVFFLEFRKYDSMSFGDPIRAFIKTMVMMMGEYDYSEMFKGKDGNGLVWEASALPFISRIIFLGFIIMASIALMNLMIGLAVSDTQELRLKSLETQLMKRAQSLIQWGYILGKESTMKKFLLRTRFLLKDDFTKMEMKLDKSHHFPEELLRSLRGIAGKRLCERKKKKALNVVRSNLLPLDGSIDLPIEVANLLNVMYIKICALSEDKEEEINEYFLNLR